MSPKKKSKNMFDNIPALASLDSDSTTNEITWYLQTAPDRVDDALAWWYKCCHIFPRLSHMAWDYLSIPGEPLDLFILSTLLTSLVATSINVKHVFSIGRNTLSHLHNR